MKINMARSAGFCFGVKRALDIAFDTAAAHDKVTMLGDIVHNEDVVRQIRKAGIKKILALGPGSGKILLIRAHGASRAIVRAARRLGYKIVDATCPMVKEIHKIARDMERKGYKIVIIGDKKHEEVEGITGQLKNKALVIDASKAIPAEALRGIEKACVVAQSTQNLEKTLRIVSALKRHIKDLKFFNTICRPTRMKQEEIREMPRENDVMLIIGSKKSANTKRLYEISRSLNKKSYWCQSGRDIEPEWFKGAASVGVTAGASTPNSTIAEVLKILRKTALKPALAKISRQNWQ